MTSTQHDTPVTDVKVHLDVTGHGITLTDCDGLAFTVTEVWHHAYTYRGTYWRTVVAYGITEAGEHTNHGYHLPHEAAKYAASGLPDAPGWFDDAALQVRRTVEPTPPLSVRHAVGRPVRLARLRGADHPMTTDPTIITHAQVTPTGQPWVEVQVTGNAAITLARGVARRIAANRPVIHADLVTLLAGAVTDTPLDLTAEDAHEAADALRDAALTAEESAAREAGQGVTL